MDDEYLAFESLKEVLECLTLNFEFFVRQQDVRATEIDKVEMHSSFRPGDIVKALVVSSIRDDIFLSI